MLRILCRNKIMQLLVQLALRVPIHILICFIHLIFILLICKQRQWASLLLLQKQKGKYQIEGIVSGALYSNYQRERLEKAAEKIGLKVFSPLWHIDQEQEVRQLIREGFEIVLSSVAAEGLDKSWLGRVLTEKDVDRLVALQKKVGLNVAGEGGEYESLVLSCPLFKKIIVIEESEILIENQNIAKLVVKKAKIL